jgi:spore coat protein A, manganese oxidase
MLNRRETLKLGAIGGAGLLAPGVRAGAPRRARDGAVVVPPPFSVPLTVPEVLRPVRRSAGTDYYEMTIKEATAEIIPGVATNVLGYQGRFPGPTIKARTGRRTVVKQTNALTGETTVHLHGGHVEPSSDGHPMDAIAPGASRTYHYPNEQPATTLWYHDHTHMMEAEQVFRGLSGCYLLEDPAELALGLPTGPYDVPLLIRDARFDDAGQFVFEMEDFRYRTSILVNGRPQPYFKVAARRYRLRLLNGSNERYFQLRLSDGAEMVQIASDGGLLPQPLPATDIILSPAERVDVVVDFSRYALGTQIVLQNVDPGTAEPTRQIMRFDVTSTARDRSRVPQWHHPMRSLGTATVNREVTMSLDMNLMLYVIDGKVFDMDRVDQKIKRGDTEIWKINNPVTQPSVRHNMHLHGTHFQILDRNDQPVGGHETGWKDTVAVPVGGSVRIKVRYDRYLGRYLYHCHLLDHSSMGMMAQLEVVE